MALRGVVHPAKVKITDTKKDTLAQDVAPLKNKFMAVTTYREDPSRTINIFA